MFRKPKAPLKKDQRDAPQRHWCDCECALCDIGAHKRCTSDKCHMPNWKDIKKRLAPVQTLLRKLPKLKFEFFGRVNSLLNQQCIHGVYRGSKTFVAR